MLSLRKCLAAAAVFVMSAGFGMSAQNYDNEGYAIVYLRGNMGNNGSWDTQSKYQFTRTGENYSLTITSANAIDAGAEFKIASADWTAADYGGYPKDQAKASIDASVIFAANKGGGNFTTKTGINDATISFTLAKGAAPEVLNVTFDIAGSELPDPPKLHSETLPVMYINVYTDKAHTSLNNEVIDKDLSHKNYFEFAEYWIDVNDCEWMKDMGIESVGSEEKPLALQIKARGNYTRTGFSKKPFKLKLDKKQNLLGLTPDKSKHYALLAHADDVYGYLRNFTMFELGHRIGLPWTPSQQPVELYINGDYRGLYFLTESIRVGDGRVDITELGDEVDDPSLVTGGYIVELDNYDEDPANQITMSEKSCVSGYHLDRLRITFDTPEVYSDLQRRFITDQFTAINNSIGSNSNLTWSYLDLDDAVRYYIVMEIISHTEAYHGSTYLFRDYGADQKWHFSPLWDAGNAFNGKTDMFFYDNSGFGCTWIPSMRANKMFNDKLQSTWLWFMSNEFDGLYDDMADYADALTAAAVKDRQRWKDAPRPNSANASYVADNSNMENRYNQALNHLKSKIEWLRNNKAFGDFTATTFTEPDRDMTEAAPLPDYVTTGLEIIVDDAPAGADVEYYNLQGVRIANPTPGQIVIRRQGNDVRKVLVK